MRIANSARKLVDGSPSKFGRWTGRACWLTLLALPLPAYYVAPTLQGSLEPLRLVQLGNTLALGAVLLWNMSTPDAGALPVPRVLGTVALVLATCAVAGIPHAPSPAIALSSSLQLVCLALLTVTIARDPRAPQLARPVLIASGTLQAAIATAQYLLQGPVGLEWLGEAATYEDVPGPWVRGHGLERHPNPLGGVAALGLVALSQPIRAGERCRTWTVIEACGAAILAAGLVVSFSRSAWVGTALGLVTLILITGPEQRYLRRRVLWIAATLLVVVGLFASAAPDRFSTRIFGPFRSTDLDAWKAPEEVVLGTRGSQLTAALELISARPLSGVGAGNFQFAWYLTDQQRSPYADLLPVHNIPLLLATELGLPAAAAFVLLLGACVASVTRRVRRASEGFAVWSSLLACLIALVMFDIYPWGVLLWVVLGCWHAARATEPDHAQAAAASGARRAAAGRRALLAGVAVLVVLPEVAKRVGLEPRYWPRPRLLAFAWFRALCRETARANVTEARLVVPSPGLASRCQLRDTFWTVAALGDWQLGERIWRQFASVQLAGGQIPTSIRVADGAAEPARPDESTLLFVIQAAQLARNGRRMEHGPLRAAGAYVLSRLDDGARYVTEAGTGGWWLDTYILPRRDTVTYCQGLLCSALLCLQEMGLDLPRGVLNAATQVFNGAFDDELQALTLSARSTDLDVSCLVGEYLALTMFGRSLLSDEKVVRTLERFGRAHDLDRTLVGFKVATTGAGEFLPPERFSPAEENPRGHYHNGGSWLLYDALALAVGLLHGYQAASNLLRERASAETRRRIGLHQYLVTDPHSALFGTAPSDSIGYGSHAYAARVLDEVRLW